MTKLKILVLSLLAVMLGASSTFAASGDYLAGVSTIGENQYSNFLGLINSPIGYLLGLVLWIKLLKWMWFELKSFTPSHGKGN